MSFCKHEHEERRKPAPEPSISSGSGAEQSLLLRAAACTALAISAVTLRGGGVPRRLAARATLAVGAVARLAGLARRAALACGAITLGDGSRGTGSALARSLGAGFALALGRAARCATGLFLTARLRRATVRGAADRDTDATPESDLSAVPTRSATASEGEHADAEQEGRGDPGELH